MSEFVFDDKGRIAFLRWSGSKSVALLVVDQEGKVLHCVPLDSARSENGAGWSGLTCVGLNKYLLIRGDLKDSNKMEGALVDVATGKATPIPGFTTTVLSELPPGEDWSYSRIAYDGKRVVIAGEKGTTLFDSSGKAVGRFIPSQDEEASWTPFLAPDGRRLLLFDGTKTFQCFELP